jgi:hypothetical protein
VTAHTVRLCTVRDHFVPGGPSDTTDLAPGAVEGGRAGWPKYGEAPIMRGFFAYVLAQTGSLSAAAC